MGVVFHSWLFLLVVYIKHMNKKMIDVINFLYILQLLLDYVHEDDI